MENVPYEIVSSNVEQKVDTDDPLKVFGYSLGILHGEESSSIIFIKQKDIDFVVVSEPNPLRRKMAMKLGADFVVDPNNKMSNKQLEELTNSKGFDMWYVRMLITILFPPLGVFMARGLFGMTQFVYLLIYS